MRGSRAHQNHRVASIVPGQDHPVAFGKGERKASQRSILRLDLRFSSQGHPRVSERMVTMDAKPHKWQPFLLLFPVAVKATTGLSAR